MLKTRKKKDELMWEWQKEPIALSKMGDGQLLAIRNTLINSNKEIWFKIPSKTWLLHVNHLIRQKSRRNVDELANQIIGRRLKANLPKAEQQADIITQFIVDSMNKNSKK